jgi:hypothetical protein
MIADITRGRLRQRGLALLELAIAAAMACMIALWASGKLAQEVEDAADQATGVWMLEIQRAMRQMMAQHFDTLAADGSARDGAGQPVYADALQPGLHELKRQGYLPLAFPEQGPGALHVHIRILRDAGCPGEACRLDALAHTTRALVRSGTDEANLPRIAAVVMAAGGLAGSVSAAQPAHLRGANFDFPNPLVPGTAPLPPGTVAVWAGMKELDKSRFLRQGDRRDPAFRGDVSVAGSLASVGRVVAGEHLKLGAVVAAGERCAEDGLLGRDASGGLLSCVAGQWAIPGGFGGAYAENHLYGCSGADAISTANPRTGACSCPPGFKAVLVAAGGEWSPGPGWTTGYVCVR